MDGYSRFLCLKCRLYDVSMDHKAFCCNFYLERDLTIFDNRLSLSLSELCQENVADHV